MQVSDGRQYFGVGLDLTQLRQGASEARSLLHGIGQQAVSEGSEMDAVFNRMRNTVAGVFAISQIKDFVGQIISTRGEIQSMEVAFQTLLGNKEKANAMFSEIRQFAVSTPMMMKDLASGAQQMLAFGIEADRIMPLLRALGDVSMGDSQKFQSLTLAFSQMSATGKLMGQDLLQMINAGFNPLQVIAEQTGKTIGKLKEEMSKGAISSDMVAQAFMDATSEGGKFHNMLQNMSGGVEGQMSNLQGAIDDMMNDLGTAMQDTLGKGVNFATTLVKHYETIGKCLLGLVVAYGSYKAALLALVAVEKLVAFAENIRLIMMFRNELGLLTAAQHAFNITALKNPYIIAGAALIGIITTIYQLTKGTNEWEKANEELNEKLAEQEQTLKDLDKERNVTQDMHDEAAKSIAGEIEKVESLQAAMKDETASIADRRRAIKELQAIVPGFQASLTDEGVLYVNNTNAVNDYIASLENLAIAKALQSKRESLQAQKFAAELERREAVRKRTQAEKDAKEAHRRAAQQRAAVQAEKDRANSITVSSAGSSTDAGAGMAVNHYDATSRLNKIQAKLDAADKELRKRQNDVAILDKRIANANADLQELSDYQKENNIKPIEEPNEDDKPNPDKPRVDARDDKERLKAEAQERQKALNEYKESLKEQDAEASFDLRQKRLELDEDGVQKELDQVKLNYDRLKHENEKRRKEMYDELASKKIVEYLDAHPNAKQSEVNDYAANLQITDKDLTKQQRSQLAKYDEIAKEYLAKGNKRVLDEMLADVQTYAQQRQKILDEYAKRESELYTKNDDGSRGGLREGVTHGNVDELQRQRDEALTSVDEQFASREEEYQAWCNQITNWTLDQLESMLDKVEAELQEMEDDGDVDDNTLARFRAMRSQLKKQKNKKNADDKLEPGERTIKEWQDLYNTLQDVEKEFENIGDTVGGVVGDIISQCGQFATSTLQMINGIKKLALSSTTAIDETGKVTKNSISTVEKASVILTVISAALQIATQIASLFNDDDKKQKEIEKLQDRIDQLQWELDNAELVRSRKFAEGGSYLAQLQTELAKTRYEMLRLGASTADWTRMLQGCYGKVSESSELMTATVDKLAKAYGNMAYTADKALGAEKYKSANEQLKNIAQQQLLIQEQIDIERSKKKTDNDAIAEYERKIEELGQQALEVINDMVEDIIGDSATGIAEELADAFFEAFAAGEDAAKAWGDKVNEIVGDILKRMMVQKFLEEPLGRVFDRYKAKWFPNGEFAGMDAVINSMTSFANDLNGKLAGFQAVMDALPDEMRQYFLDNIEDERSASQGGIATASQESVDELNGRATAIQGHTYSISENTKTLVANTSAILASVMNIENNTGSMAQDLMNIHTDIRNVRASVDHIQMHGLKLTN